MRLDFGGHSLSSYFTYCRWFHRLLQSERNIRCLAKAIHVWTLPFFWQWDVWSAVLHFQSFWPELQLYVIIYMMHLFYQLKPISIASFIDHDGRLLFDDLRQHCRLPDNHRFCFIRQWRWQCLRRYDIAVGILLSCISLDQLIDFVSPIKVTILIWTTLFRITSLKISLNKLLPPVSHILNNIYFIRKLNLMRVYVIYV